MKAVCKETGLFVIRFFYTSDIILRGWLLTPDGELSAWDASSAITDLLIFSKSDSGSEDGDGPNRDLEEKQRSSDPPLYVPTAGINSMLDRFWPFADRLYENLFPAEVRTLLQAQTGQLAIVAHHALNCLPFGALGHGPEPCVGHRWQTTIISSIAPYMHADRRRDPVL